MKISQLFDFQNGQVAHVNRSISRKYRGLMVIKKVGCLGKEVNVLFS